MMPTFAFHFVISFIFILRLLFPLFVLISFIFYFAVIQYHSSPFFACSFSAAVLRSIVCFAFLMIFFLKFQLCWFPSLLVLLPCSSPALRAGCRLQRDWAWFHSSWLHWTTSWSRWVVTNGMHVGLPQFTTWSASVLSDRDESYLATIYLGLVSNQRSIHFVMFWKYCGVLVLPVFKSS